MNDDQIRAMVKALRRMEPGVEKTEKLSQWQRTADHETGRIALEIAALQSR